MCLLARPNCLVVLISLIGVGPSSTQQRRPVCLAIATSFPVFCDRRLGVQFERVLTDNGACYRSRSFRRLVRRLGMRHLRTRPYTPRTNGKAERLVQTSLREWAYARSYANSEQRAHALQGWLHHYNWHRPHASLGYRPPITRIPLNNVVGLHN